MDIDDKELFSSAMADAEIPETVTETPAEPEQQSQQDDRPRDEHGRFAPKQAETTVDTPPHQAVPQGEPAKDEAYVPPWRLREIRDERDAINQRYLETQRQLEMLRQSQPKPEPKPAPDLFENPNGAIEYGVQQYVDPQIQQMREELAQLKAAAVSEREETSRELAIEKYGEDVVRSAYTWIAQGIQSRDPNVVHAYNQAMQARRPFEVIVQAHKEISLMQQIKAAGGVEQWREQQLSQPSQQQTRQASSQPQGSITKLPPSLRNTPSARGNGADEDSSDMSDAALFRHAMR